MNRIKKGWACHFRKGKWSECNAALCESGQRGTVVFKLGGFKIAMVIMTRKHSKPLGFRGKVQQKRNDLKKETYNHDQSNFQ